jgi:uncharacterized protein YjbJ (UPF0337 family)
MNQDQIEARWKQFTGSARDRWDKLSGDDIGALAGSSRPAGKIQKPSGIASANRNGRRTTSPPRRFGNQP